MCVRACVWDRGKRENLTSVAEYYNIIHVS